ncbi:hypothetical protein [Mesorhizobium sp.]|uniref:hypothetical protein n=1 Tax=Mesorhizobium sp. TaxID=1871066 RepID=UPI0025811309|nr:hypothetical protein [Mesorhizobium sp.]
MMIRLLPPFGNIFPVANAAAIQMFLLNLAALAGVGPADQRLREPPIRSAKGLQPLHHCRD